MLEVEKWSFSSPFNSKWMENKATSITYWRVRRGGAEVYLKPGRITPLGSGKDENEDDGDNDNDEHDRETFIEATHNKTMMDASSPAEYDWRN